MMVVLDCIRNSSYCDELYHLATGDDKDLLIEKLVAMLDEKPSTTYVENLVSEIEEFRTSNTSLEDDNDALRDENENLKESYSKLNNACKSFIREHGECLYA